MNFSTSIQVAIILFETISFYSVLNASQQKFFARNTPCKNAAVYGSIKNLAENKDSVSRIEIVQALASSDRAPATLLTALRTTGGDPGTFGANESSKSSATDEDDKKSSEAKKTNKDSADVARKPVAQCSPPTTWQRVHPSPASTRSTTPARRTGRSP